MYCYEYIRAIYFSARSPESQRTRKHSARKSSLQAEITCFTEIVEGEVNSPVWLEHILQFLSPNGILLIADMVLDENYAAPSRHLLSAIKLLATGGGHLLSIPDYQQLLHRLGLEYVQVHRLATTDLIVASPRTNFSLVL